MERLGGADDIEKLEAEPVPPALVHARRQRLPGGDADAERAEIEAARGVRHLEEPGVDGGHREEMRRPLRGDHGEEVLGVEPLGNQDGGGAGEGGKVERVAEAEGEEELGSGEDEIIGPDAEDAAPHQLGGAYQIALEVHGGLGPPGGAGRVAPERDVVAAGVGGLADRRGGGEGVLVGLGVGRRGAHDQHGRPPPAAAGRGEEVGGDRRMRHHGPRTAILDEEGVVRRAQAGVERHRHRSEADGPPERLRELGAIGQREQHALLDVHAARAQRPGGAARPRGHFRIGDVPAPITKGDAVTTALGEVAVEEEGGGVEALGDGHRDRHRSRGARSSANRSSCSSSSKTGLSMSMPAPAAATARRPSATSSTEPHTATSGASSGRR